MRQTFTFDTLWTGPLLLRLVFWHVNATGSAKYLGAYLRNGVNANQNGEIALTELRGRTLTSLAAQPILDLTGECLEGVMPNLGTFNPASPVYIDGSSPGNIHVLFNQSINDQGFYGAIVDMTLTPVGPGASGYSFDLITAIDSTSITNRASGTMDPVWCTPDSPLVGHPRNYWPRSSITFPTATEAVAASGNNAQYVQFTMGQSIVSPYGGDVNLFSAVLPMRYNRVLYGVDQRVSIALENPSTTTPRVVRGYLTCVGNQDEPFRAVIRRFTPVAGYWSVDMPYVLGNSVLVFEKTVAPGGTALGEFDVQVAGTSTYPIGVLVKGGGKCLAGDTEIEMWDGTKRRAADLKIGDCLVGLDKEGALCEQIVVGLVTGTEECVEITHQAGAFKCSLSHEVVLGEGKTLAAAAVSQGCQLRCPDGSTSSVLEVTQIGLRKVVGLHCVPDENYVSDGIVHHNKYYGPPTVE